jgi:hypothetical protein
MKTALPVTTLSAGYILNEEMMMETTLFWLIVSIVVNVGLLGTLFIGLGTIKKRIEVQEFGTAVLYQAIVQEIGTNGQLKVKCGSETVVLQSPSRKKTE